MNNTYQLFLKLRKPEDCDQALKLLQELGFNLFKQSGTDISNFRNYYFRIPNASNQCEIQIRLSPNETFISNISVQLFFGTTQKTINELFDKLTQLQQLMPFHLLDYELRNSNYEQLYKEGKVSEYLSDMEKKKLERNAYIPINFNDFQNNLFHIEKRKLFFSSNSDSGERAPDDSKGRPTAKEYRSDTI